MKLPYDSIIAPEKITRYLLQWRPENDKSGFLARGGYKLSEWEKLSTDIKEQFLPLDAHLLETTDYGEIYEIRGKLVGPNEVALNTVTIWMTERVSKQTKLITLYPDRKA